MDSSQSEKQVSRVIPLLSRHPVFKVQNPQVCILVSHITIIHYYLKTRCGVYTTKQPLKLVSKITTLHDIRVHVLVNIYRCLQGCILVSKNTTSLKIRALINMNSHKHINRETWHTSLEAPWDNRVGGTHWTGLVGLPTGFLLLKGGLCFLFLGEIKYFFKEWVFVGKAGGRGSGG